MTELYKCLCGASWMSEIPKENLDYNQTMETHLLECPVALGAQKTLEEEQRSPPIT